MLKLYIILPLLFVLGYAGEHDVADTTKLDLSHKGLKSLKEYDFSIYPVLEEIDLSNNYLEHIKENTFLKNAKLLKINLSGNHKLSFPKYSTLLISDSVEEIDLSNCSIRRLPQSIFDGLRKLKTINLSNNPIKKKGLDATPLQTIESLQKIILPNENNHLLKELCTDFNFSIEIRNETASHSVDCKDYEATNDEDDEDEDFEDEEEEEDDEEAKSKDDKTNNSKILAIGSLSLNENSDLNPQNKTNANPQEATNEKPHLEPRVEIETNKEANKDSNTENKTVIESSGTPPETISKKVYLEPRIDNDTKSEIPEYRNIENSNLNLTNANTTHNETKVAVEIPIQNNVTSIDSPNTAESKDKEVKSPNVLQRGVEKSINESIKANSNDTEHVLAPSAASPNKTIATNSSEKMQVSGDGSAKETEKVSEVTESSNTGSTILIVLIIAVVVAGLAAFGYKFYKNRTHRQSEPVERELKEIMATKPFNEDSIRESAEQEPLMNNHTNKENGDPKTNQQILSNNLNTGPYQPTTTTFKPIDQTDDSKQ